MLLLSKLNGRDSSLPSFMGVTRFIRRESFTSASGTAQESPFSHTSDTSADTTALSTVTLLVPIVPSAVTSLVAIVLSGQLSSTETGKQQKSTYASSHHGFHSTCDENNLLLPKHPFIQQLQAVVSCDLGREGLAKKESSCYLTSPPSPQRGLLYPLMRCIYINIMNKVNVLHTAQ